MFLSLASAIPDASSWRTNRFVGRRIGSDKQITCTLGMYLPTSTQIKFLTKLPINKKCRQKQTQSEMLKLSGRLFVNDESALQR